MGRKWLYANRKALGQLQDNLAEQISARRMKLLQREVQSLWKSADYNMARGIVEESENYKALSNC